MFELIGKRRIPAIAVIPEGCVRTRDLQVPCRPQICLEKPDPEVEPPGLLQLPGRQVHANDVHPEHVQIAADVSGATAQITDDACFAIRG